MSDAQFAEDALQFEQATSGMAKAPDTAEQFAKYHGVMRHALIAAGERMSRPYTRRSKNILDGEPMRVGFFMPTATLLAHSRNLLTYLDALKEFGSGKSTTDPLGLITIEPRVYTFAPPPSVDAAFSQAYSRHDVTHLGHYGSLLRHWEALREAADTDELDAMVFVSVVQGMAFATSMGVAPKHIWWAHKWHGLDLPCLDGYIDACHPFVDGPLQIGDRTWRSTYTALPEMFDASKTEEAKKTRAGLPVGTVFGWMGRTEKLTSEYLTAVAQILERVPDSIFVYTGREEPAQIAEAIATAGLGDRIAFIGWVDTALWAQVIDVYLDAFPFQSGHCAYQAMAAAKPVIWLHDEQVAQEQSASGLIRDTWEQGARAIFGDERPWCTAPQEYVVRAASCAAEPFRTGVGQQMRHWLERFMMDRPHMAQSVTRAILEIVDG